MFAACLAGPVTANQGLVVNIPVNSSTGGRRLAGTPNWGHLLTYPMLAIVNDSPDPGYPAFKSDNSNETTPTTIMGVNEKVAYFGGKLVSSRLIKNEGNR